MAHVGLGLILVPRQTGAPSQATATATEARRLGAQRHGLGLEAEPEGRSRHLSAELLDNVRLVQEALHEGEAVRRVALRPHLMQQVLGRLGDVPDRRPHEAQGVRPREGQSHQRG